MDLLNATHPRDGIETRPCSLCCGEGSLLLHEPPGRFDMREECWIYEREAEPCPDCRGTGLEHISAEADESVALDAPEAEEELPF